ncbi:tetratricopeptide repeat protein [Cyclobacterium plantarum]|uniref:Tetratricopeptide repeat protein n=1 Tax=Cyclobacterium plantarum TaxID=2716263 RepID=A0ABX0HDD7_9BACT|nr:tetratricopeptide repeat protein [Cyclobacterium plantarum]NHE58502.1 tetratricopeptide repeat protein [Cyclobacterium plantarum]
MNEIWIEKFEDYLLNRMSAGDKQDFEDKLASDMEMREAFNVFKAIETDMGYLSASREETAALNETLDSLNDKYIRSQSDLQGKTVHLNEKNRKFFFMGIAAALVLIVVSYVVFVGKGPANMNQTAEEYFASNLLQLGQTMGSSQDSLQLGIAAYNKKEYDLAQAYFEGLLEKEPENAEVLKNLGLAQLANGEYDNAIAQFERLSQRDDLLNNPGLFFHAITLLIRNEKGDREMAKDKLEQVVAAQSEGSRLAAEWLEGFE